MQAVRSLHYASCCKIGVRFRTAWWRQAPFHINHGGQASTHMPIRLCIYPSYGLDRSASEPAVLLCSYTWAQDAQRMASLRSHTADNVRDLLMHNLALLHATADVAYADVLGMLHREYVTYAIFDWESDPFTGGGAAYFEPGQFSYMLSELWQANDGFFIIGEATSWQHAWVQGALDSAAAGIHQMMRWLVDRHPEQLQYAKALDLLESENACNLFGVLDS
ncbi:FAD-linked reductase [Polychaeton citri CBS 116435]|uniref:FAD-linked reductase n=1 Tax=Polychaeton citri CBS 116435 TaxID=1314669 RepID=A0A9P4PY31_9PEZI|nr:FAD-linked reductase [Polychaeton citri CBS 116435]